MVSSCIASTRGCFPSSAAISTSETAPAATSSGHTTSVAHERGARTCAMDHGRSFARGPADTCFDRDDLSPGEDVQDRLSECRWTAVRRAYPGCRDPLHGSWGLISSLG